MVKDLGSEHSYPGTGSREAIVIVIGGGKKKNLRIRSQPAGEEKPFLLEI